MQKKRRAAERASLCYGAILGALSGFGGNGLTVGAVLLPVSAANRVAALVVLVVEDEPLLRCSVAESLREVGYTVIERASGEEAIALCKSNMSIDVVFTDITLTGAATGWDVAVRMRADRPQVSVLYTSGKRIDPGHCVPGSAFIAKPYQHDEIVYACQRLCVK